MDINSAFNSGLAGFQRANEGLARNALTIARQSAGVPAAEDLNTALVQSKAHELQAESSIKVVKAAEETVGTLLNVLA